MGGFMDDLVVVQFVQKTIKERRSNVLDILENNGIASMEQYATLMGELNALNYIAQELSFLLEKQEQLND
jgi:hypothetical protein